MVELPPTKQKDSTPSKRSLRVPELLVDRLLEGVRVGGLRGLPEGLTVMTGAVVGGLAKGDTVEGVDGAVGAGVDGTGGADVDGAGGVGVGATGIGATGIGATGAGAGTATGATVVANPTAALLCCDKEAAVGRGFSSSPSSCSLG